MEEELCIENTWRPPAVDARTAHQMARLQRYGLGTVGAGGKYRLANLLAKNGIPVIEQAGRGGDQEPSGHTYSTRRLLPVKVPAQSFTGAGGKGSQTAERCRGPTQSRYLTQNAGNQGPGTAGDGIGEPVKKDAAVNIMSQRTSSSNAVDGGRIPVFDQPRGSAGALQGRPRQRAKDAAKDSENLRLGSPTSMAQSTPEPPLLEG